MLSMAAPLDNQEELSTRETIDAAFRHFDINSDGLISCDELQQVILELRGGLEVKGDLTKMLAALDDDNDGFIGKNEFIKWWKSQCDDLDGDGKTSNLEEALKEVKLLGMKKYHVDLHTACWNGDLEVVEHFLEDVKGINQIDKTEFGSNYTPLHYAAYQGHTEIFKKGANVLARNEAGCTPLYLAAQQGRVETVSFLLEANSDARICDKEWGYNPIQVASSQEIIQVFKSAGANSLPSIPGSPILSEPTCCSLKVTWKEPYVKNGSINPISGYKLRIKDSRDIVSYRVTAAQPTSTIIKNLHPLESYKVEIAAVNVQGSSGYSEPSDIGTTLEGPPMSPQNLRCSEIFSSKLQLCWTHPKISQLQVTNYSIDVRIGTSSSWIEIAKVTSCEQLGISGLLPEKTYSIRVSAWNSSGKGEYSEAITITTLGLSKKQKQLEKEKFQVEIVQPKKDLKNLELLNQVIDKDNTTLETKDYETKDNEFDTYEDEATSSEDDKNYE